MNCLVYCQHVLGIGHLCRILLILRQMTDFRITLVLGGSPLSLDLPDHVQLVQLPGLCMDEKFSGLRAAEPGQEVEAIKEQRRAMLLELFGRIDPELLLVELFPFGRNAFCFELLPLLELAGKTAKCRVACSVRDILVERDNAEKFEQRVIDRMERFFDLLLIHGDPAVIRLDQTFSRMEEITVPTAYTGYICQPPQPGDRQRIRRRLQLKKGQQLILVSAGSGSVGRDLLAAADQAFLRLAPGHRYQMQIFTGPYLDQDLFAELSARGTDNLRVDRFTDDFPAWLAAADLSLSMGGYNTTMNVVAAGCPALVLPFDQNHEQRLRASRLEKLSALQLLDQQDLDPERLAEKIRTGLERPGKKGAIQLDGAAVSAELLTRLVEGEKIP